MTKQLLFLIRSCIALCVFAICSIGSTHAQDTTVQGIIKDAGGPLPGVSISVKGTSIATVSGNDGRYTIKASSASTLVYSSVGYAPKEVKLAGLTAQAGIYKIDISLTAANKDLDDVVVVGFGKQKKVNLTGAVSSIDAKAFESRPVVNATQALQGKVAGLNITQNNGSLDASPTINMRGIGTISGNSSASPLILIDGMEGQLNVLNPQDIDNISFLKDASASSIYGSRAAFGVILVTTKRGKSGLTQVNYNNNFRITSPVSLPQQLDSYNFALYYNDASINGGSGARFSPEYLQRIRDYQAGILKSSIAPNTGNVPYWQDGYDFGNDNVDWYKEIYSNHAFSQEHNLSLNGGNDKTTYYLSTNYLDQKGLLKIGEDLYSRYSLAAKINTKISEAVSLNYSTRFLREDYRRPSDLGNGLYANLARQGWPTLPLYDPNGFLYSSPSPALGLRDGGITKNQKDWMYQQLQLVFEPIKGWRTFAEVNYRTRNDFNHYDVQKTYNHDVNGNAYLYNRNSAVFEEGYRENYFNSNIYSEFSKTLAEKHNFKVMGGFQTEMTRLRGLNVSRQGIIVPELPTINTTSGADPDGKIQPPVVNGDYQAYSIAGFFGRLNYDYDGKYLLEANLRYDASSRFRADQRWTYFPSVSVGWNIAREDFVKDNLAFIDVFKFRSSYGSLGNQTTTKNGSPDPYPTYLTLPVATGNGNWLVNGAQPNTASAPGLISSTLTWETVKSLNLGLDFAFFKNRLTGSFDWYNRKTINMLGPATELPVVLGTAVPPTNNTDLKTVGFELELGWADKLKNGLGYSARLQLSDNQTTVTRFPNPSGSLNTYIEGRKLGEIWGYTTIGIAKTQAEMDAHLATSSNGQNFFGSQWAAGDIMYADFNGDGKLDQGNNTQSDSGDKHVIGNFSPRYNFGLDLNVDYKGFDLRVFFQGVLKRDFYTPSAYFFGATDVIWFSTGLKEHLDYFRADPNNPLGQNLDAYYARPIFGTLKNQAVQTRYLQDASYIHLKNLQLGYSLPVPLVKKLGLQKIRVYASGENLWTATKLTKIFDPETIDYQPGDSRSNGNVYPITKALSFGLSVTF